MRRNLNFAILICGLALLAAFPVLAQSSEPVREVRINKKPFRDLGNVILNATKSGELDLTQPFKVAFEGKRVKSSVDGHEMVGFDRSDFRWIAVSPEESGNAQMVNIAKAAIEAVGDSGFFGHLYNVGFPTINGEFSQTDQKVAFTLKSEFASSERAKTFAFGLSALFTVGALSMKGNDEKLILNGLKATSAEKFLSIEFQIGKDVFHEMVKKIIAEAEKNNYSKPSSSR